MNDAVNARLDRRGKMGNAGRLLSLIVLASSLLTVLGASAAFGAPRPGFTTDPGLSPNFGWNRSDYAVRCLDRAVKVRVKVPDGWRGRTDQSGFRTRNFTVTRKLRAGVGFRVTFQSTDPSLGGSERSFHVRCIPADLAAFRFATYRKGTPRLTFVQMNGGYAVIFDRNGAPVWWFKTNGLPNNFQYMKDGTISYAPASGLTFRHYVVRTLNGRLVRRLTSAGDTTTDIHDLIRLPNGNYMLGAHRFVRGVNTRRYKGSANSTLDTTQIQELTPGGKLVWKWDAWPRIKLSESKRWWPKIREIAITETGFDVHHWNSVAVRGRYMLLSFRHLDAVLRVDRRTKQIRWKLGGTRTAQSLRVRRDPAGRYPFGGQHDAQMAPNKSITLLDNSSFFEKKPRAVRYQIDRRKRTATLIDQVRDPRVIFSLGFASARLQPSGEWLIDWGVVGANGLIGTYKNGRPISRLLTPGGTSYRATVPSGPKPSIERLRQAMDDMARDHR